MSKAWCTCGDEMRCCDENGEGLYQFNEKLSHTDLDKNMTYYCFGCNIFFTLKELPTHFTRKVTK